VVTSTLDGKTTLPSRIHWLASPKLPASSVREVAFLVDGKVRWIEHMAPYTYGEDGGYLVTTWLAAGRHRFTARVTDTRGRVASDSVSARVGAGRAPPRSLAGAWTRRLTAADQKKAAGDPPPVGQWRIVFDRVGVWELDPFGGGTIAEYAARNNALDTFVPIQMGPDGVGVSKYRHTKIGGFECGPDGPFGSYRWSVSGTRVTLTARKEGCGARRAILEGIWKRP
jgi:hypothetical protein